MTHFSAGLPILYKLKYCTRQLPSGEVELSGLILKCRGAGQIVHGYQKYMVSLY
jgi:hypothetical protein